VAKLNRLGRGVFLTMTRDSDGTYRASLRFNATAPGDGMTLSGFSWHSITHAFAKVAQLAEKVLSNPIVSSILPPGVGTAVQITSKLVDLAEGGHLNKPTPHPQTGEVKPLWQHFDNPVLQQLAKRFAKAALGNDNAALTGAPICLLDHESLVEQAHPGVMGHRYHHHHRYPRRRRRGGAPWGWGGWGPWGYDAAYDLDEPGFDAPPGPMPATPGYPSHPFYDPYRPSRGIPTDRPIRFRDAYRRIYGPQPGGFRFPRFPGA
jgi:hypothetical protein